MNLLYIQSTHFSDHSFCAGPWGKWVCVSALSRSTSVPYSPLSLLNVSWTFWVLTSPLRVPRVGVMWSMNPLFLRRRFGFFGETASPSPTCLHVALVPLVVRELFSYLSGLWENCSTCSCRLGVFTGRGEFRFFLHHHLGPGSWTYFQLL